MRVRSSSLLASKKKRSRLRAFFFAEILAALVDGSNPLRHEVLRVASRAKPRAPDPTGTVTFLFSDIEGSTVRWEHNPDAMAAALAQHDALVRAAMEARGGYVFKTVGDAFCVVFAAAPNAIAAALDAQRTLIAQDFASVDGLRVRMALHSGHAEERDGDYFGPTLNRVARLLAIAHGGQVLVSGRCAEYVERLMPPESSLRDLGAHRLKDLAQPERVYQLVAPDLPGEFPQLRSLDHLSNNLPGQVTSFVGRQEVVAEIRALLERHRLVTLVGAGGAGKTRCAIQVGAELVDASTDGVWLVELAPISDPSLVVSAIALALNAQESPNRPQLDALITYLKRKRLLIILDNCEHLVDESRAIVSAILRGCPDVRILATSREMLHLDGECVYRLGSLALDAAVELFTERAAAVSVGFNVLECQTVVRSICERLDGLPLAIELAAARVRTLSVEEISERLHERFRLLTSGSHTAMPRQQTLAATIAWSYDLLTREEQRLFAALAAFRGSFSLAAGAAVSADGGTCDEFAVLDLLTSLADKSLLTVTLAPTARYRFLETIRAFAAQKADESATAKIAMRRHGAYFSKLAAQAYREFDSRVPDGWLERLAPDIDNFRAALTWTLESSGGRKTGAQLAADCGPIFLRMELLAEGLHWCEAARRVASLAPATAGRIYYVASMMQNNLGQLQSALESAQAAVSLYRVSSDTRGLVRALSQEAQLFARAHRFDQAEAPANEAIREARRLGEPSLLITVLRRCAVALPPAEIERARVLFDEALRTARSANERYETCLILQWWASRESGERAMELAAEALEYADDNVRIGLEANIAGYALAAGKPDEAKPHARRAVLLAFESRIPLVRALAITYWSPFHSAHDPKEAAALFGYAGAQLRKLEWQGEEDDRRAIRNARRIIEGALQGIPFEPLANRGAGLRDEEAFAMLAPVLTGEDAAEHSAITASDRVRALLHQ